MNEKEKKKNYNERILQVEHGSFTPFVMTANGGFARENAKFYARLAELIASKRTTQYSVVSAWIKRKVVFSLMNSIGLIFLHIVYILLKIFLQSSHHRYCKL